ncbi:MAG: HAMP domain-containing protein [Betaproteobacteria bacterium]|nr:HAMP domain-containing protein [Betaproteobacteria bacterium]
MSNSRFLWKKVLFLLGSAFLLGFVLFSCAIVWGVMHGVKKDAESRVEEIAALNEVKLKSLLSASYATVIGAAAAFENLDRIPEEKRRREGDAILALMFNDVYIYNAWGAYEPDSFDGKDLASGNEYPGAPSGRYIRSYVRSDEGIVLIPDMDENELNDPDVSRWYTTPLNDGKVFYDFDTVTLYDYKTDEGNASSITISSPVLRDGKPVGVVGGDILARDLVLADKLNMQVVTAVFSPDGTLIFSRETEQVGMTIEDMRFSNLNRIRGAMRDGRDIFLKNEFSWFLDAAAFIYLKPVLLEDLGVVYIYAALPSSLVNQAVSTALFPIVISLVILLFAFVALLFLVAYYVSNPLNRLMYSMNMISGTGVVQDLPYLKRQDEIGDLARSVSRLWQYFRMRLNYLNIVKVKLENYLAIQKAIHKSLTFEEASKHILRLLRVSCKADTARFFIYMGGQTRLFAISGKAGEFHIRKVALAPEFEGHEILASALEGKHYLLMKPYAMRALGLEFVAPKAWSVCILPIRAEDQLRAFIILEASDSRQVILHDDSALNFIAERLSGFFVRYTPALEAEMLQQIVGTEVTSREGNATSIWTSPEVSPPVPEPRKDNRVDAQYFMNAARLIPGLEVDSALSMLGDNSQLYMGMLSLSARELSIAMDQMREFLASGDINAFAIEAHGSKGVLNTIGAPYLGEKASRLEIAANEGDLEGCRLSYPDFEKELADFVDTLHATLPKSEESVFGRRSVAELIADLEAVRAALEGHKMAVAIERMRNTMRFSYITRKLNEAAIAEKLEIISAYLDNIKYEEANKVVQELLLLISKEEGRAE